MLEKLFLAATITISLHLFANMSINDQKDHLFGQSLNSSFSISLIAQK